MSHHVNFKSEDDTGNFVLRRREALLEEFLDQVGRSEWPGGGELSYRRRGWSVEFYTRQPHPRVPRRTIKLPQALLQATDHGMHWRLFFRNTQGHWQLHPAHSEDGMERPGIRLPLALRLLAHDADGLFRGNDD